MASANVLLDVGTNLDLFLSEQYSNEQQPHAGEVYRKIRQYQGVDEVLVQKWKSHLSKHGQRCLHQLTRHTKLAAAFDALLVIPGLWGGFILTTLHKIIAMKCDEVSVRCPK